MPRGPMTLLRAGGLRRAGKEILLSPEPALPALDALAKVGALGRREHVADVGDRVGDALGGGVRALHLLGAQGFKLGAVDRRSRQRLENLLARFQMLGAQREDVVGGFLGDR